MFILIVIIAAITDMVCGLYLISTEKREALKAGSWCALYVLLCNVIVISFVEDKLMILASVIGAFIGTYLIIRIKK